MFKFISYTTADKNYNYTQENTLTIKLTILLSCRDLYKEEVILHNFLQMQQ